MNTLYLKIRKKISHTNKPGGGGRHLYSQDSGRQRQIGLSEFKFSLGYIRFNLSKRKTEGSHAFNTNTVEVETEVIWLSGERNIKEN